MALLNIFGTWFLRIIQIDIVPCFVSAAKVGSIAPSRKDTDFCPSRQNEKAKKNTAKSLNALDSIIQELLCGVMFCSLVFPSRLNSVDSLQVANYFENYKI